MNPLRWLAERFRPVKTKQLVLHYEIDCQQHGQQIVRIATEVAGVKTPISDIRALLRYNYSQIANDGRTIYVVSDEDRQILLALQSLNPRIEGDTLLFWVVPDILRFIRQNPNITETPASKKVTIVDHPVKPVVEIDYTPGSGLHIRAGYIAESTGEILRANQIPPPVQDDYIRVGNTFARLPHKLSEQAEKRMKSPYLFVLPQDIPGFFNRELALVPKDISTSLSDQAKRIRIIDEPLEALITAQTEEHNLRWLDIRLEYEVSRLKILPDLLGKSDSNGYIQYDAYTWIKVNGEKQQQIHSLFSTYEMKATAGEYRLPMYKFADLVEIVRKIGARFICSQEIRHQARLWKPVAEIDYQPDSGLIVRTGYAYDRSDDRTVTETNISFSSPHTQAGTFVELNCQHIAPSEIPEFFSRDLVLLKKQFTAVLTEQASGIQIFDSMQPPLVRVQKDERGWLDFQVEYRAGDLVLTRELLQGSGSGKYIQYDESTWIKIDKDQFAYVENRLRALDLEQTENGYRMPVSQFATLEDFIHEIGGHAELDAEYRNFLAQLTDFSSDTDFTLAQSIEEDLERACVTLRPYQRAGIHWLTWLHRHHLHGLLADDMGLGKTIQSLCALRQAYETGSVEQHSLIIAPKSVLLHWQREIDRVYPHARTCIYHGISRTSYKRMFQSRRPIIFISTYETISNDIQDLIKVPFYYVILDEATRIKNPSAKRTQGIKSLNSAHRIALSGTPVENRPAELWSLFDFLIRGHLGRYGTFQNRFETPILNGNHQISEALGQRVKPFFLRRLKEEVAQDLPEKIEMDEWCELTDEQRMLYGGLQEHVMEIRNALRSGEQVNYTSSILPVITKLKQICDHPSLVTHGDDRLFGRSEKFDIVVEKIRENYKSGESTVVFSHFLGMLTLFERALNGEGIRYIRIDGSTNKRQQLIDFFNQGSASVALCSVMAAGQGINLTAANHVIHVDRWWNPAIENQATDRVHRIGQNRTVYVLRVLVSGTLEERIDALLAQKQDMADSIVSAAAQQRLQWTREELLEILKPLD